MSAERGSDIVGSSLEITGEERRELGYVLKNYRARPGFFKLVGDKRIVIQDTPSFTLSEVFKIDGEQYLNEKIDEILNVLIRKGVVTLQSEIDGETVSCTYVIFPNTPPLIQKELSKYQSRLNAISTSAAGDGERKKIQDTFSDLIDMSRHIADIRCRIGAVGSLTQDEVTRLVEEQVNNLLLNTDYEI